jgi:hypothetical protein
MTEKKEEDWKKEIAQIMQEQLRPYKEAIDRLSPEAHKPPEIPEAPGHKTIEEMLACPDCYPKVRDGVVKKEGFKPPIGKRDRHEYEKICKECGLRVKKDEKECPNCGSTETY